ncbi:uncharacterized protein LOC107828842 [Nicotiana tabacum]|uniref:Uncharacterized protein LOC107828842 n=1 Tax=Nicotiana tabacum TaxID=4097 RepID=A0AC58UB84_TOBAC
MNVRGPKSYEDLRTVSEIPCSTFRESAEKRGLLYCSNSLIECMLEAVSYQMPYSLRRLFATLLVYCNPADPKKLWEMFEDSTSEDFKYFFDFEEKGVRHKVLSHINDILHSMGHDINEYKLIPKNIRASKTAKDAKDIHFERNIIVSEQDLLLPKRLNIQQLRSYNTIIDRVFSGKQGTFFVDGPGGTASILPGGRTAHSRFKMPIDIDDNFRCNISKQSSLACLIRDAKLIVWDEASMAKKNMIEALDALLRDIMDVDTMFGGKVVVFGERTNCEDKIEIPDSFVIPFTTEEESLDALFSVTYLDLHAFSPDSSMITSRVILTTKNDFVNEINNMLITKFPQRSKTFVAVDETIDPNDQSQFEDFLHSLDPPGLPPYKLTLKENCPVILLRNLNPCEGLCNGTRLTCCDFRTHVISAKIESGDFKNTHVFIPRIPLLISQDEKIPVQFKRTQFPLRLCFAMTINKAQGQILDFVGIYLREPVFSHGQLYVALSRAKSSNCVKILIRPSTADTTDDHSTYNVVYDKIIQKAFS